MIRVSKIKRSKLFMAWREGKYDEKYLLDRAGTKLISPIVSPCNGFVIKLSTLEA
jgi:hypothetical protein